MKCETKYRPIIWGTDASDQEALKMSYLAGDGLCPACKKEGRETHIEERFGESTWESDGTYAVCVDENNMIYHAASLD